MKFDSSEYLKLKARMKSDREENQKLRTNIAQATEVILRAAKALNEGVDPDFVERLLFALEASNTALNFYQAIEDAQATLMEMVSKQLGDIPDYLGAPLLAALLDLVSTFSIAALKHDTEKRAVFAKFAHLMKE